MDASKITSKLVTKVEEEKKEGEKNKTEDLCVQMGGEVAEEKGEKVCMFKIPLKTLEGE